MESTPEPFQLINIWGKLSEKQFVVAGPKILETATEQGKQNKCIHVKSDARKSNLNCYEPKCFYGLVGRVVQ